jgi:glycosyltransferase involved in cell wall biosynthesis
MTLPAATIVIPAYNAGPWIEAAVWSALGQTFTEIEVIVLDDGSTDDTPARVQGIRDSRLQYFRSDVNGGFAQNVGRGIAMARGRHLVVLGADDILHPTFLHRAISQLDANPGAAMLHTAANWIDERGRSTGRSSGQWPAKSTGAAAFVRCFTDGFCFSAVAFVCEHLKCLRRPIDEWRELADLWLFLHACCAGDILFIDEVLVEYRVHLASISFGMYANGRMFRDHRQRTLEAFDWPEARAIGLESHRQAALAGVSRDAMSTLHMYRLNASAFSTFRYFCEVVASAPKLLLEPAVWARLCFSMLPQQIIRSVRSRKLRRKLLAADGP